MFNSTLLRIALIALFLGYWSNAEGRNLNYASTKVTIGGKTANPHSITPTNFHHLDHHFDHNFHHPEPPYSTDEPLGEVFILGTTWFDYQGGGSRIKLDTEGYVHALWTNDINTQDHPHIYYQVMNPQNALLFPGGGVQVNQTRIAYSPCLELYSDNRAMPCFTMQPISGGAHHSEAGFDYIPRMGAFGASEFPRITNLGDSVEVYHPQVARSLDSAYHFIMCGAPDENGLQRVFYLRGEFSPYAYIYTYNDSLQDIGYTVTGDIAVAASTVSNRVAVAWLEPLATGSDTNKYDNNLIICVSNDGLNWDWSDTLNLTNWYPPSPAFLPDTARANQDTFRCFGGIDLLFENSDYLQAFFTTVGYYHYSGEVTIGNSLIWFWHEQFNDFSVAANGWFENGWHDPGVDKKYVCHPVGVYDSLNNDLYCVYQRYFMPLGASTQYPYPYQIGDTTDFSASGWPNGEIWVTKRDYYWGWPPPYFSWYKGTNVIRTPSPAALPGDCRSEMSLSAENRVVNDHLHLCYILDKDAGYVEQFEGTWTLNDVFYQRAPLDSLYFPYADILPPIPLHCDSSSSVGRPGDFRPGKFTLYPPCPNPFNQRSLVSFSLKRSGNISLSVYDIQGQEITVLAEGWYNAGTHRIEIDGAELSSGMYFIRLQAGEAVNVKKVVLLK